jgi:plastocyanin
MKGRVLMLLLGCAAALLVAVSAGRASATATSVGVTEREFRISLGRLKVPHGTITFNVNNIGQDDHDVVVRRRGRQYGSSGRIAAGTQKSFSVRLLKPGVYNVLCSLPGHRSWGMVTRLTVT